MSATMGSPVVLQPWFRPELRDVNTYELYFRGSFMPSFAARKVFIKPFGTLIANTYFNSFSLYFWDTKTTLDEVFVTIEIARGRGEVLLFHETQSGLDRLDAKAFDLAQAGTVQLSFSVKALKKGLVFWEVRALSEVEVTDARYETHQRPEREVKLGVVVTTFKREAAVTDAMARFSRSALVGQGHRLLVIDNGQSVPAQSLEGVELLPNANLGGAGGFSRGLMEVRQRGGFTHCLFMDDDASTHMECIEKAIAYLAFARSETLAICGAMFFSERPWIQFEAGAQVKSFGLQALKCHRDMRDMFFLQLNEDDEQVDYGGWWFYAFNLKAVTEYAFPFFVRGDDIVFGLRHGFESIAPSGIATWQPTFEDKISPSVEYLAHRAEFLIAIVFGRKRGISVREILHRSAEFVWNEASCFRYGIAHARCQAMEDVLAGPDFWRANPTALPRFTELKARYGNDYPVAMTRKDIQGARDYPRDRRQSGLRRLMRHITWDGHLLPPFLARKKRLVYGLAPHRPAALQARSITYYSPQAQIGIATRRSLSAYLAVWWRLVRIALKTYEQRNALAQAYEDAFPELTSEAHWRRILGLPPAPAQTPNERGAAAD